MLTSLSPTPSTAQLISDGFTKLMQELAGDPSGYYKAFPQPDGHTLIGRIYGDWQDIADHASVLIMLEDGTTRTGHFHRESLVRDAEFRLTKAGELPVVVLQEFVQSAWQPVSFSSAEVFHVAAA